MSTLVLSGVSSYRAPRPRPPRPLIRAIRPRTMREIQCLQDAQLSRQKNSTDQQVILVLFPPKLLEIPNRI
nr:MAG TPA: hypothetical protein [Bacteriophage sp.]